MTALSPAPRVGVAVLVERTGKVLLFRRTIPHGYNCWAPPGGHLEYGEGIEACAIREVEEETGLTLSSVEFLGITNDLFQESGKHYITIWMRSTEAEGALLSVNTEGDNLGWFDWDNLPAPLFLPFENLLQGQAILRKANSL